jgi:hypothetical protein
VSSPHLGASQLDKLEQGLSFDQETRRFSVSVRLPACVDLLDCLGRTFASATPFQGPRSSAYDAAFALTQGSSILWTMPNFPALVDAGNIPPLTPGPKFKVVTRGVFDPFEFVLVGFVAGLGQTSNSNPSYGHGARGFAKRYDTSYADDAIENFMSSAVSPPSFIRIPVTTS